MQVSVCADNMYMYSHMKVYPCILCMHMHVPTSIPVYFSCLAGNLGLALVYEITGTSGCNSAGYHKAEDGDNKL